MASTITMPVWALPVIVLALLAWSIMGLMETRALRWLYEYYRHDRDTLSIQLRDAFIAGAAFGRYGEPDQRRVRDEAFKRFPFAAVNPTRRPSPETPR